MKFAPGFFGSILTGSGDWEANLTSRAFQFTKKGEKTLQLAYELIDGLTIKPGTIWAEIVVKSPQREIRFDGLTNDDGHAFVAALRKRVADALLAILTLNQAVAVGVANSLKALLGRPQYIARRDIDKWTAGVQTKGGETAITVFRALHNPLFPHDQIHPDLQKKLDSVTRIVNNEEDDIKARNEKFIVDELQRYTVFFDGVEATPLTEEQRRAAVIMEDRNLLVAAAGSGKTSSVVGKVGYALLRECVLPEQILVLAFNNHAAKELAERIQQRLGKVLAGKTIKVKTFHALGLEIIAEIEDAKPTVPPFVVDQGLGAVKLIDGLVEELLRVDAIFAANWTLFNAVYLRPVKDPTTFEDAADWHRYVKETGDYDGEKNGFRTLNGELVKSQGELAIADWLFMNGVNYEYERPYKYRTADKHYRQYHPDFYFPDIDTYLEHYALDANGRPPAAFGERYAESMQWKRALHEEKRTDVFETFFSEFIAGDLFPKLEKELKRRGLQLRPRSSDEILRLIKERQGQTSAEFSRFLLTFIKHAKSNQFSIETLEHAAEGHSQKARALVFIGVVGKLMAAYEKKLRDAEHVDFEDMLINAARYAHAGRYDHPYRLILVDEFQDISRARADLLTGLLKQSPDCKMFAVGDDWQSIYRFAGSDISLFTHFSENFGATASNVLTQTFRSNQGIADVAAKFVQENSAQMRKTVVAMDKTVAQVVVVRKYEDRDKLVVHILACLKEMALEAKKAGERRKVLFLARYRFQKPEAMSAWEKEFGAVLDLEFTTVHSSKGLQANYVVLLNLQGGKLGFPSQVADDPLLQLVMPVPDLFPHAEERRLFYVALTRARNRVYLLASKYFPSSFLEELEQRSELAPMLRYPEAEGTDEFGVPVEKCPRCGRGQLRLRNGQYGPFYGCSEYPSCKFKRDGGEKQKRYGRDQGSSRKKSIKRY